jgi:hypothetical protein
MVKFSIEFVTFINSSSLFANFIPPAFPLPPTKTCAFTTTGKEISLAIFNASSAFEAKPHLGTGILYSSKICLASYS